MIGGNRESGSADHGFGEGRAAFHLSHAGLHCLAELHVLDLFGDDVQGSDQRDARRHHGGELPCRYCEVFFAWIFLERLDVDFSVETGAGSRVSQIGRIQSEFFNAFDGLVARLRFDHTLLFTLAVE